MDSLNRKQEAVDLSHHINVKSKSRHPSPLKEIIKFMGYDGMISLAGGLPHPSLFPLDRAKFDCLPPSASLGDQSRETDLVSLNLGRGLSPGDLDLTQFLQYGTGAGNQQLIQLAQDLTEQVHAPPCHYECLLHPGNTNAWSKVVGLLCEDNDFVIVEEFTYPSAQALWIPLGIKAAPVSADAEGILATNLREMLENWDEKLRGSRRPRVLYLVSVGSNPTGITISAKRRREIYQVCVEFDLVIVEDDPYYFLQYPGYSPQAEEQPYQPKSTGDFLKSLTPSFLSMDTQGRVIRLESFSKTIFPGLRLGYFIANPLFTERLLRATEVETQDPAGLSQAFTLALFNQWGLMDIYCGFRFTVVSAAKSPLPTAQGHVACLQDKENGKLRPVFSFVDPEAGMFVWSKFYFGGVARFVELEAQSIEDPEQAFAQELWEAMVAELVLLTPGSYYHAWQGPDKASTKARGLIHDLPFSVFLLLLQR
uniref:Aminotransferase class I/classII large domain-containing protein n=1 Tax=Bionectria ochroleuca TaxID=29856 RepID=A0A8H7TN80_BIOOC